MNRDRPSIRTRAGITIGGALIAQKAEAEAIDQSWHDRLLSDAAKARALRREHAVAMKAVCEKNLTAYRESDVPTVPYGRAFRVCLSTCLVAAAVTLLCDMRVWRPDPPKVPNRSPETILTGSSGSLRQVVGQRGDLGGLLTREPQGQRGQAVRPFRPKSQE